MRGSANIPIEINGHLVAVARRLWLALVRGGIEKRGGRPPHRSVGIRALLIISAQELSANGIVACGTAYLSVMFHYPMQVGIHGHYSHVI